MASTLFSTKQVMYGTAPFTDARIGYNAAAGCLNLLVPGVKSGLQIVDNLKGDQAREIRTEGTTCFIGEAPHLAVEFATKEEVTAFQACIQGEPKKALPLEKASKPVMEEPMQGGGEAVGEPAPSTPPARGASARLAEMGMTPPRAKKAKVEEIAVEEFKK
eukprot:CAMPEP_0171180398 /NCGR_PEP_ID=MMETSP0790-20130122/13736_1 /TAXON_ID=2925 /ORGANISM="Alexandrium catenella, Strain OF101" /LENGTH=160 /DNA_ID=CAMNT_0011645329 /DNA_START=11 /DNA_END=493 /DNA_ORIENTATION=+